MGVYIKGMEMPKSCYACDFSFPSTDSEGDVHTICTALQEEILPLLLERQEDCPLIEVPPHGRLIDADALEDKCHRLSQYEWNKLTGTTWGYAYATFESEVEDAQTVIPADKDGET